MERSKHTLSERKKKEYLLAAAPDLLEALERIAQAKPDRLDHSADVAIIERAARIARAAIAKAKGGND